MGVLGGPSDTHQNFMGLIPSLTRCIVHYSGLSSFSLNYCTSLSLRIAGLAYISTILSDLITLYPTKGTSGRAVWSTHGLLMDALKYV